MPKKLNSAAMTKVIQESYLPSIEAEVFHNSGTLSRIFSQMGIGGKVNMPSGEKSIYISRGTIGSVGGWSEDATFSKGSTKNTGEKMVLRPRWTQANVFINPLQLSRLKSPEAIENLFANQFEMVKNDLSRFYARSLYQDGSGIIGSYDAKHSTTDLTKGILYIGSDIVKFKVGDIVTLPKSTATAPVGTNTSVDAFDDTKKTHENSARWISESTKMADPKDFINGKIDMIDLDNGLLTLVDEFQFTVKGLTGIEDTTGKMHIYARGTVNNAIHGLGYIVGDKGYFGIGEDKWGEGAGKRTPYLNSYVKTINKGGTSRGYIEENDFLKMLERMEYMNDDNEIGTIITSESMRRSIASYSQGVTTGLVRLVRNANQSAANDQRSLGGYQGVDINGEAVQTDRMAPKNEVNFLALDSFDFAVEHELKFENYGGNSIWKQILETNGERTVSYAANMYAARDFFSKAPQKNGKIIVENPGRVAAKLGTLEAVSALGDK